MAHILIVEDEENIARMIEATLTLGNHTSQWCPDGAQAVEQIENGQFGLVLLENVNDETFSVEKIVQFYPGHQALDSAFHWGMRWQAGRK